jgi:hypothetical protein
VDALGSSFAGVVVPEVTLPARELVGRLIPLGTPPHDRESTEVALEGNQFSVSMRARGILNRFQRRAGHCHPEVNEKMAPAQQTAIAK